MTTPNPKLYRELSEPYASAQEAQAKADELFKRAGEIRKELKIPNLYLVIGATWMGEPGTEYEGKELAGVIPGGFGDSFQHEAMLAYALGIVQAERQSMIGDLLAKGIRRLRER